MDTIPPEHQCVYSEETEQWPEHLSRDSIPWSDNNPAHPSIEQTLESTTVPTWAADKDTAREQERVGAALTALEYVEKDIKRFIEASPEIEDDIKQFLRMTVHGNNKTINKLQEAQAALSLLSTEIDKLPAALVSFLISRIQTSELLIDQYHDNIKTVSDKGNAMGITPIQTNQT